MIVRFEVSPIVGINNNRSGWNGFLSYYYVMGGSGFRKKTLSFSSPPGFLSNLLIKKY